MNYKYLSSEKKASSYLQGRLIVCSLLLAFSSGCLIQTPSPTSARKEARFDHIGLQTCSSCHIPDRPSVLLNGFDHSIGGTGDCAPCHMARVGLDWTRGAYNHTPTPGSCGSCHSKDQPTQLVDEMDHNYSGLPDCKSCHLQNMGNQWSDGVYSHTPTPDSCDGCHSPQRPVGWVGRPPFNHSGGGSGDCSFCHKNIGQNWNAERFTHTPTPTTCIGCHLGGRPEGVVGNPPFDHAFGGTGDCVACHHVRIGVTWLGGSFSHAPVPTSCAACHTGNRPSVAFYPDGVGLVGQHYGTTDCYNCHRPESNTVFYFNFNHENALNETVNTCLPCHQTLGQRQHGSSVQDCVNCHHRTSSW